MHLIPGAVTPLGILNDEERKVKMFLDDYFLKGNGLIGVHPNDNTATVWMQAEDFKLTSSKSMEMKLKYVQ